MSASRSRYVLQLGDRYEVTSSFSVADEEELRATHTAYPDYIRNRYLDLPDVITQRTLDLAVQLTEPYDNPYDKAVSVQNFLREYITYNDQIDAPPPEFDPVDYVLFESREGYCNYYASAMAIMLRSQGIPTRLGRGFAAGEYNEDNGLYRVRARDAHVWVEVFFNDYGWVPFEPTTIIATIDRTPSEGTSREPSGIDEDLRDQLMAEDEIPDIDERLEGIDDEAANNEPSAVAAAPTLSANNWQMLAAVLVVAMAAGAVLLAGRMNRAIEGTIEGSYSRLAMWGRWLRLPMMASQTPNERADVIVDAVPEGEQPVRTITDSFVRSRFSKRKQLDLFTYTNAEWRELRPILFREGIRMRLPKWLRKRD